MEVILSVVAVYYPLHGAPTQKTQNSFPKTDSIPISESCKDVQIDSAGWFQSRFSRHTLSEHETRWGKKTQYNGNMMGQLPFKLCVPIRIIE